MQPPGGNSAQILELRRAQVAECGVQSACVVDLVNEAGMARGDLLERFVVHEVGGISLNAAAPGKRSFLVFGIAPPILRFSPVFCPVIQTLLKTNSLIQTARLNDVDPQAWLADVLARLPDHPARRIEELLPWQWCGSRRLAG